MDKPVNLVILTVVAMLEWKPQPPPRLCLTTSFRSPKEKKSTDGLNIGKIKLKLALACYEIISSHTDWEVYFCFVYK